MRTQFTNPITTLEEARAFLTYLHEQGLSYHPEDSATDCIERLVTQEEALQIDKRMDETYQQDWPADEDPCGFILELDPDYLRNAITNRKEDLERIGLDALDRANGPDLTPDENRECGELSRDLERLEKLLAAKGVTQ